jgi:UDP-glucose:(heptosyl)LPS alpha-1,3-glucosyltransferase
MRDEVGRRFGVPGAKIRVIYPGYSSERFRPEDRAGLREPARSGLGVGTGEILFGLITSGDFVKRGVELFISAFSRVRRTGAPVRAVVIGKESRLAPYLQRVAEEGMTEHVTFLPPTPDIARYYHALDVYVHPARYEEFGQSVQEALACGVPVVAGARVGAAELLNAEAREYLLEEGSVAELSAKLAALAGNADRLRRLGELGPAAVAGNTWNQNFAATLDCYNELLRA